MDELPLAEHINGLRKRLISIAITILACSVLGLFFANDLVILIIRDIVPGNVPVVALSPLEYMLTVLKAAFYIGIVAASPFILYHAFMYVKPGLKKQERQAVLFMLPSAVILFLIGASFCYFILVRITLIFLASFAQQSGITSMWGISGTIDLILAMCFVLGLVFEMPLVFFLVEKLGILSMRAVAKQRAYFYVGIFIVAAIATPTADPFTQIIVAVPMVCLFELSLVSSRIFS